MAESYDKKNEMPNSQDVEKRIAIRLLKSFEAMHARSGHNGKHLDGKSIAVGSSESDKDVWNF